MGAAIDDVDYADEGEVEEEAEKGEGKGKAEVMRSVGGRGETKRTGMRGKQNEVKEHGVEDQEVASGSTRSGGGCGSEAVSACRGS